MACFVKTEKKAGICFLAAANKCIDCTHIDERKMKNVDLHIGICDTSVIQVSKDEKEHRDEQQSNKRNEIMVVH